MPESFVLNDFAECLALFRGRLTEPAGTRIQLLTGPRQVGKTTLLLELAREFGSQASYHACDAPEASVPGHWERLWSMTAEAMAKTPPILLLDEIQHLSEWSSKLKSEWDRLRRIRKPVHVVATGSSSLRVGAGSRESLAGRFERITLTHWSASSISSVFGLSRDRAAEMIVSRGAYPGSMDFLNDLTRWSAYVRDAIVEPAIGRDILALGLVRKPSLLRQVFAICTGAPAQIVSLQKMQGSLIDAGTLETISHYLSLLQEAFLVAPLEKYSASSLRRRSSPPKLIVLSNALMAATDPRGIPDPTTEPARYGAWVENACIAHAVNSGQRVSYWREKPLEVDAIIEGSWGKWALEVKTTSLTEGRDVRGLGEFTKRHPSFRSLLVGKDLAGANRFGIETMLWRDFLLDGPPR